MRLSLNDDRRSNRLKNRAKANQPLMLTIRAMNSENDTTGHLFKRLLFFSVKLPGIYFLMLFGLAVDFLTQFPFAVICTLENRFSARRR